MKISGFRFLMDSVQCAYDHSPGYEVFVIPLYIQRRLLLRACHSQNTMSYDEYIGGRRKIVN